MSRWWSRSSASESCYKPVTQLKYWHCTWECWEWTKQHINNPTPTACGVGTKGTWQLGQISPAIWKQHTAPLRPCYKSRWWPRNKFSVSNFHPSREHFVSKVNIHFVTCSRERENMQEDLHKAGWFCQLCEVTHSVLLPGDSSSADTSAASGLRPLHSGLLWSLPKI